MKIKLTHAERKAAATVRLHPPKDMRLDLFDDKGRRITADSQRFDIALNGVAYFGAWVDQGRDGKTFGPGCDPVYFDNAQERDAYVEKRFDTITRNAQRKFLKI